MPVQTATLEQLFAVYSTRAFLVRVLASRDRGSPFAVAVFALLFSSLCRLCNRATSSQPPPPPNSHNTSLRTGDERILEVSYAGQLKLLNFFLRQTDDKGILRRWNSTDSWKLVRKF